MNLIQKRVLDLADLQDLSTRTCYSIAKELGVDHPYKVKFALDQLVKKGLLVRNKKTGQLTKVREGELFSGFLNIPIYGEASCGPPVAFADETIKDFLKVSPSAIKTKKLNKIFALRAVGNSMARANINGQSIDDGDFVLVESKDWSVAYNGDYIVSIIEGMANIKKFFRDETNERVLLMSETFDESPPIIIANEDLENYKIAGKVIEVIKA